MLTSGGDGTAGGAVGAGRTELSQWLSEWRAEVLSVELAPLPYPQRQRRESGEPARKAAKFALPRPADSTSPRPAAARRSRTPNQSRRILHSSELLLELASGGGRKRRRRGVREPGERKSGGEDKGKSSELPLHPCELCVLVMRLLFTAGHNDRNLGTVQKCGLALLP
jgi:hypothetical protein